METADLSHHISRRFNEDLERVRSKVLGMGGFVEQQLAKAITALVEGDSTLGESVALDDYQVNNMEVTIDEECSRILATRAPAAGDLRVIVAIIKTITDLERIGDEGEKIGYIASRLATMERRTSTGRSNISAVWSPTWCTTLWTRSPAWTSSRLSESRARTGSSMRNTRPSSASPSRS
jgi:phosphate transport system protein